MRQHSRLSFRHLGRIEVTEAASEEPLGQVTDLSLGGVGLTTSQPLSEGISYSLCLHVPDHRDLLYQVPVQATCRWVRRGRRRDSYEVGLSLDQPSQAFNDLVAQLLPRRR